MKLHPTLLDLFGAFRSRKYTLTLSSHICLVVFFALTATATTRYVDINNPTPADPYTDPSTAATNIQDAIEVAAAGDTILVTNGIYASGGKVMGNLTNRVVLDKALTLQSVNGSGVTIIQGASDPTSTNGPAAVRCVWMTNNAVLSGFTLRGGATAALASPRNNSMMGGGVWSSSTNATLDHCLVCSNYASYHSGGAYQATLLNCQVVGNRSMGCSACGITAGYGGDAGYCNLKNCVITGNVAPGSAAAGAYQCNLANCVLQGNWAFMAGGAAQDGSLVNCTIFGNTSGLSRQGVLPAGAVYSASLTNCIVWGNFGAASAPSNYYSCTLTYCCASPLSTGTGNIGVDPQLLADGVHLAETSPCRGVGLINIASGTDIDGQAWANPPSMGCDEWQPVPLLACQPTGQPFSAVGRIAVGAVAAGHASDYYWYKDGVALGTSLKYGSAHQATLVISNASPSDAGFYLTVVSNSYGMATSQVARVVIHCVDAAGINAQPPFADWATASTNIQTAIDLASAGEFVLVTNGLYASGGKAIWSSLTNRVALDKALTVVSVNGAAVTTIQGAWDPATTNGPAAVRCAALTNGAAVNGFTLIGGATRARYQGENYGGGVFCATSTDCRVMNCIVCTNSAADYGGGAHGGLFMNCLIVGNFAASAGGGGAGGVDSANLANSTIVANSAPRNVVGGASSCNLTNCIIAYNLSMVGLEVRNGVQSSCCSPQNLGGNNIFADPQLLDSFHLAGSSPCLGAGNPLYAIGTDLEGDPWLNPPSIGCDEAGGASFSGPLQVAIQPPPSSLLAMHSLTLTGRITGHATRLDWSFGDSTIGTNASFLASHTWTNAGDYTVTLTAYNADNVAGVSATQVVHVVLPAQPLLEVPVLVTNSFQLTFPGEPSITYVTEYATNLTSPVVWTPLQTSYGAGTPIHVTDVGITNTVRFYRVRAW